MENQQAICDRIGSEFVKYYYNLFDTDRAQLQKIYTPESTAIWEGQKCYGRDQIMAKITGLPIQRIQREITSHDHQIVANTYIMTTVIGQLSVDNDPIMGFQQSFILKSSDSSWVCINESFRLAIHNFSSNRT